MRPANLVIPVSAACFFALSSPALADPGAPSGGADAGAGPAVPHGPASSAFPSHHFQWAPHSEPRVQIGVNFGLSQLLLSGFNVAAELRYKQLWFEYSHGQALTLNSLGGIGLTSAERDAHLHVFAPYTTGFGVGWVLLDELWIGAEFKTHRFEVNAPGGPRVDYQTYSVGGVLGYKFFVWRGLHINLYLRYWPNVATSLENNKVALTGDDGQVTHDAHSFDFFANVSIGYAVDL